MRLGAIAFAAVAGAAISAPAWALNTTNLIGFYRFDERDGASTVRDDFGQSNGTMMEFTSTVTGRVLGKTRGAIAFDGANSWVKIPDNASNHLDAIATNNAFSIAAWIHADAWPASTWVSVASRQKVDGTEEYYYVGASGGGIPALIVHGSVYAQCLGTAALPTGAWVHLAATFDGATDAGRLYVNGVEVCSLTNTGTLSADTKPLVIGGNGNSAADDATELFDGIIDDVLVYSRALTKVEVQEIAAGAQPLITKYWICPTGSGCFVWDDTNWSLSSNGTANTTAPTGPYQSIVYDGGSANSKSGAAYFFEDYNVKSVTMTSGFTSYQSMDIVTGTSGLTGSYYDTSSGTVYMGRYNDANIDFASLETMGTDRAGGSDTFQIRWTGQVKADATDDYTFHSYSDDGIRVNVNGVRLIDSWIGQDGSIERSSATVRLQAGQWYDLDVTYYESGGGSLCKLLWSRTGATTHVVIPSANFRPAPLTIGTGGLTMGGGQFSTSPNAGVLSSLTITGGTFAPGPLTVAGSVTQSGGTFNTPTGAMVVGGDLNLSLGSFNAPSGTLEIGGKFNQTGGTFNHNNGTVTLKSASAQNLTATGTSFHNLQIGGTSDPAGLASRWKFEEGAGRLAADTAGTLDATLAGAPVFSSTVPGAISSFSTKSLDTTGTTATVWNSYSVLTQAGSPKAIVVPTTGNLVANLDLYESSNDDGVDLGTYLTLWNPGASTDGFSNCEKYWSLPAGGYIGKSNVARGSDVGEANTPSPTGVYDFEMHPPNSSKLMVAAFVVPVSGTYAVKNLGVRRVSSSGGNVELKLFNAAKALQVTLTATNNQDWVTSGSTYSMGSLAAGSKIYIAVDVSDGWGWDATEVAWTIERTAGSNYAVTNGALSEILKGTGTVTAWIKTGQTGNANAWDAPALLALEDGSGQNDIFWGFLNGTGKICMQAGNGSAACSTSTVNGNASWFFVALTRDATSGAVEAYVGSTREGTATSSTGTPTYPFAHILAMQDTWDGAYFPYSGLVDDLRVYNRVLTASEIAILAGGAETGALGATHTLTTSLTVNNNLTILSGATLSAGANTIYVKGNWANSGTFTAGTSTVELNGTASGKTVTPGSSAFYNLRTNGTGGEWTLQATTTVTNDLTLTAGTLAAGSTTLNVAGAWLNNGGTFTPGTSTVTFNGSSVSKTITPNANAFHNLTVNGSGSTYTLAGALDCNGTLNVSVGTLATANHAVVVGGSISKAGTITPGTSTLTFDGTGTGKTVSMSGVTWPSVTFNGSGSDWTLNSNIQVAGDVSISAGTVYGGSTRTLTVGGGWVVSGTGAFDGQTSILNFNAASGTKTISGASTFNRVEINGAGTYQLGSALDVNGDLVLNAGVLSVGAGNYPISVAGAFSGTGTFTAGTGTVTLDGATGGTLSTASHFYNLAVTGAGTWTLGQALYVDNDLTMGASAGTINTNASGSYHIYVAKNLSLTGGAIAANSATIHLTAASGSYSLGTNGSAIPTLALDGAATWTISGSTSVGTLTQATGSLNGGTGTLTISSGWTRTSGTFTPATGTVSLAGGAGTRTVPSGVTFYNLDIAATSSGVWQLGGSVSASNAVTIQSGATLNLNAAGPYTLSVGTNLTNSGTIVPGNGTVDFTGAGGTINAGTNGAAAQFYNLKISGAGNYTLSTNAVTVSNDLLLAGGTLTAGALGLTVGGNWNNTAGTFACSANTVTLTGASKTITPRTSAFCGLTINTGASYTQAAALVATGDLTITGTLATGSLDVTVGGSLTKTGTLTPGTSLFTLNGTTGGKTLNVGSTALDRLTINGSGGGWTMGAATTVTNALNIGPGTLNTGAFLLTNSGTATAANVLSGGTLSVSGNGSATVNAGLTVAAGGALTLTGTTGQTSTVNVGSGKALTINGAFTAIAAGVTKTIQAASSYYALTVNGSGSAAALNIDGLEVKNTDANGLTINSASAATFTSFKNIAFSSGNPTASRYLSIDANSLVAFFEGLTFDSATTSNVRLVGHGSGAGTVKLTLRNNSSGTGAGESRDIDDDSNGDDVPENAATNGAVIMWVDYHTDIAGTSITFPVAAFDWNSFTYYATYLPMQNINGINDDYIYVRNADGTARSYGWTLADADGNIMGTPRPIQDGSNNRYLIVLTTTGKVFKLLDNGTDSLDKVNTNWPYTGVVGCTAAETPAIVTAQYAYWACENANGKNKWMARLDHTATNPNTLGASTYQYANNSNTIKPVTPAPALGTVGGTEYIYYAAQSQAYGLPTGTMSNPLTDTGTSATVSGRVTFYGGRVYFTDDVGKLWVKSGSNLATNHWVFQDLATHSNSCTAANCKMANFTVGFKTGNSTYPRVYWGDADGHVYAVHDNGAGGGTAVAGFPFQPSGSTSIAAAPAYDVGTIIVGNTSGEVFVINQRNGSGTRELIKTYSLGASVSSIGIDQSNGKYTVVAGTRLFYLPRYLDGDGEL